MFGEVFVAANSNAVLRLVNVGLSAALPGNCMSSSSKALLEL